MFHLIILFQFQEKLQPSASSFVSSKEKKYKQVPFDKEKTNNWYTKDGKKESERTCEEKKRRHTKKKNEKLKNKKNNKSNRNNE